MTYRHSVWHQNYIQNPQPNSLTWNTLFHNHFRLPYSSYLELLRECKSSSLFNQWGTDKVNGYNKKPSSSIELLLLAALRYLGRGWTFDDLQEATIINYETIRLFIHKFIEFGSTVLYKQYVISPSTSEQLAECGSQFSLAGMPGCIGSTDATHVVMEKCIYRLAPLRL